MSDARPRTLAIPRECVTNSPASARIHRKKLGLAVMIKTTKQVHILVKLDITLAVTNLYLSMQFWTCVMLKGCAKALTNVPTLSVQKKVPATK